MVYNGERSYVGHPPKVTSVADSYAIRPMPFDVWKPMNARNMPMPPEVASRMQFGMAFTMAWRMPVTAMK